MRKLIPATIALSFFAGSAFAADLPSYKAPPPAPLPPPPPMWTGFYLGLNAGYTFGGSNNLNVSSAPLLPGAGVAAWALSANAVLPSRNEGFIGGGQIGYNWQFWNSFVAGVEADIQGVAASGGNGSALSAAPGVAGLTFFTAYNASNQMDYFGTVRGRLGYLLTPTILLYGTGGLAYAGIRNEINLFQFTNTGAPFGAGGSNFSDTRVGWTVGGGGEWMFWPNWSAKVEYLYYDLGSATNAFALVRVPPFVPAGVGPYAATLFSARYNGHIVRAGVNYHFNWGAAPVMATY